MLNSTKTNSSINKWAEDLNRHFPKGDIQTAKRHMKRRSTSLIIREILIKTTTRYDLIAVRVATIRKSTNSKCWRGCGEQGTSLHCRWECKLVQPLWRTVWKSLKKLQIELPYVLAIPPLGIHLEKNMIWNDTCAPMLIAALFTIPKTWKQPRCPSTEELIKKMRYMYKMEYYSATKNNEIMPSAATCDRPRDGHTERSKSDREGERYSMTSLLHGI